MRDNKDDNRGFSLVEFVIVIAIISIFAAFMTYGFGMVTGKQARQCANNLGTALDKAKNYAMARSGSIDAYLLVKQDGKSYIAEYYLPNNPISIDPTDCYLAESEKLGKASTTITCVLKDGTEIPIEGSTELKVYFDRITGAFKDVTVGGSSGPCDGIRVQHWKTFMLKFHTNTGKHEIQ